MGYYKINKIVVVRQRDDHKTPVSDMNEKTESANRELLNASYSTRARLASGKFVKRFFLCQHLQQRQYMEQKAALCKQSRLS